MAKVILVEWKDSHISALWEHKDSPNPLCSCITVGFKVRETDTEVELSSTLGEEGKACTITIAKSTITSWRELWQ